AAVLGLAILIGAGIAAWLLLRRVLAERLFWAPAVLALVVASGAGWFAAQPAFLADLHHLQALVGGQAAAERAAIGHQVSAASRAPTPPRRRPFSRAGRAPPRAPGKPPPPSTPDPALLAGGAAPDSPSQPRRSADGGRGLLQVPPPPFAALRAARLALGTEH